MWAALIAAVPSILGSLFGGSSSSSDDGSSTVVYVLGVVGAVAVFFAGLVMLLIGLTRGKR